MLIIAEKPVKMLTFIKGGEGLGRAIMTVGRRKSAAWIKAVVGILVRVVEEAKGALLAGYMA